MEFRQDKAEKEFQCMSNIRFNLLQQHYKDYLNCIIPVMLLAVSVYLRGFYL